MAEPDDDVLGASCDIITALMVGGPAEDIDDYRDAPRAVELLLGHLERRASDLSHFLVVHDLEEFLTRDGDEWPDREPTGVIARASRTSGLGPEFQAHLALGLIVQDLKRFPGQGWELVATALRSPIVSNRNMA